MREAKAQARSCVHAGLSEPSTHADVILFVFVALRPKSTAMVIAGRSVVIRTVISCADQFKAHCGPLFYFLIQYYHLNS